MYDEAPIELESESQDFSIIIKTRGAPKSKSKGGMSLAWLQVSYGNRKCVLDIVHDNGDGLRSYNNEHYQDCKYRVPYHTLNDVDKQGGGRFYARERLLDTLLLPNIFIRVTNPEDRTKQYYSVGKISTEDDSFLGLKPVVP